MSKSGKRRRETCEALFRPAALLGGEINRVSAEGRYHFVSSIAVLEISTYP